MNTKSNYNRIALAHIVAGLVVTLLIGYYALNSDQFDSSMKDSIFNSFLIPLPSMSNGKNFVEYIAIAIAWMILGLVNLFIGAFLILFLVFVSFILKVLGVVLILGVGIPSIFGGISFFVGFKPGLKIIKYVSYAYSLIFPIGAFFTLWCWWEFKKIEGEENL